MIDVATYDHAETTARGGTLTWTWPAMMTPNVFAASGFPLRISTTHELRPLLDAMHYQRFRPTLDELNGLSEAETQEFLDGLQQFFVFALETFGAGEIPVPLNTLLVNFLTSRKLRALPRRARVLEIGAGCGYLPFFCPESAGFEQRHQIEVTQSLYILQSRVNAFLYRAAFNDLALEPAPTARIGRFSRQMRLHHGWHEPQYRITLKMATRATLYPWWRIDDALDEEMEYDVIVSNANLAEMTHAATVYYFDMLQHRLAPDGVVLIEDLGAAASEADYERRQNVLTRLGYRALAHITPETEGARVARVNMLLVREGHPHWDDAAPRCEDQHFPRDIPLVRAVYGLDRPPGDKPSRNGLFEAVRMRYG